MKKTELDTKINNLITVYGVSVIALAVGLGFLVVRPALKQASLDHRETKNAQVEVELLNQLEADTEALKVNLAKVKGDHDEILSLLPLGPSQEAFVTQLANIAQASGFNMVNFSMISQGTESGANEPYLIYEAELSFLGPSDRFVTFLRSLDTAPRFLGYSDISIGGSDDQFATSPIVSVVMRVQAYYRNPAYTLEAIPEEAPVEEGVVTEQTVEVPEGQ